MNKVISAVVMITVIFVLSLFFLNLGWNLFMVPVFNMNELSISQLIGLSFIVSSFRGTSGSSK